MSSAFSKNSFCASRKLRRLQRFKEKIEIPMQEMSGNGMTLRWPLETDTTNRKVLVEAGPAAAPLGLQLIYSIAGGPLRMCRGWPVGVNPDTGHRVFAARLPETRAGQSLDWWPRLTWGVHELGPAPSPSPQKQITPPEPGSTDDHKDRFAYEMDFLARVTAPLARTPTMIGDTPEGLMIAFPLGANGTVRGPKLNGRIQHIGGDWMRVRPDGVGISQIRVVVECVDGTRFLGEYGGVVNFGPDGYAALSKGGGPEQAEVQLAPRFVSADAKLDWLNRVQCVGLGRVTMASLLVEYDLYAARSYAARDSGECHV